ncbi:MAG: helix-turn-helix transcriptional regulator [Spirochaetaceae bacterium]
MSQQRLIGRDAEVAALHRAWESARTGNLVIAFVHGEAGIGKTELINDCAERVSREAGAVFMINAERPRHRTSEVDRLLRAVRRHYGNDFWEALPSALQSDLSGILESKEPSSSGGEPRNGGGDPDPGDVAEALGCAAAIHPLALLIDGVNHASVETLRTLESLAQDHVSAALMIVGTYRDHEVQPSDMFTAFLAEVERFGSSSSMHLGSLPEHAVRGVLEQIVGYEIRQSVVDDVVAATRGNPLYVTQVAQAIQDAVALNEEASIRALPGLARRIAQAISRRFSALSDESQETLRRIAILGERVSASEVHIAVPEMTTEELDAFFQEALRQGFIVETTSPDRELQARLSHPIIRDAIAGMMSPIQRSRIALEMAQRIEESAGGTATSETLARLYCQAVTPEGLQKCAVQSLRAGHHAIQRQDWAGAVEHFERYVANQGPSASHQELGNALVELSRALLETNRRNAGKERMREAFEHLAAAGDVDGVVALVTYPYYHFGYRENLVQLLERARAMVPPAHPGRLWVSVRYAIALHDDLGDYQHAFDVCKELLADKRIKQEPAVACRAAAIAAISSVNLRDLETAKSLTRQCERFADVDPTLSVWREYTHEYLFRAAGNLSAAEESLNRALVHAYRFRDRRYRWTALVRATDYAFRRGDLANAVAHAEEGISLQAYKDVHLRDRGAIALLTGDEETFGRTVRELRRRTSPDGPWPETARVMLICLLTLASRYLSEPQWGREADDLLNRGHETLENPFFAMRYAAASAYRAFITSDRLRGAESYRQMRSMDHYWVMGEEYRLHRLATGASAAGFFDEAEAHFTEALAEADRLGNKPSRAMILNDHADHILRTGTDGGSRASELRTEARAAARELGLRILEQPTVSKGKWSDLLPGITERELEVLRVVARGSTNQQIADTLGISTNTVAFHVRSIMEKLGLANRAQAVAFSWKNGIVTEADLDSDFP